MTSHHLHTGGGRKRAKCGTTAVLCIILIAIVVMIGSFPIGLQSFTTNKGLEIKIGISTQATASVVAREEEEQVSNVGTANDDDKQSTTTNDDNNNDSKNNNINNNNNRIPYLGQIDLDLQPWRGEGGITLEMLDHAENATQALSLRFHIRNGQFYISSSHESNETHLNEMWLALTYRWQGMLSDLAYSGCMMDENQHLPDLDAVLAIGDGTPIVMTDKNNNQVPAPLFGFQKKRQDAGILIPYVSYWATDPEYFQYQTDESPYANWTNKKDTLFWRGSTTGGSYTLANWREKQRAKAVLICKNDPILNHSNLCDVKYYNFVQIDNHTKYTMLDEIGGLGEKMSLVDHMQFKYLLTMDGNGPCSGRFEKFLSGTSAMFKVDSDHIEFYYNYMEPMKHYIPIKEDLSDLRSRLIWAMDHQDEVRQIVQNMREFSQSIHQRPKSEYLRRLLAEYSKLLQYDLTPIEQLVQDRIVRPIYPEGKPNSGTLHHYDRTCTNAIYACNETKETDDSFLASANAIMGRPGMSTAELCKAPQGS